MEPLLQQAYEALLDLEERFGARLSNRDAILEEIQDGGSSYRIDLASFNGLVRELAASIPDLGPEEALARLVRIRLLSLALEEEFRSLSNSIEKAVSELSGHVA
ncbi:hypothetical protein [Cognatilysobacter lacus]|uniref:Uncharacterized protein n=1 Tax=Cognatilysobacter lacus TaxID=1643323 RepID=A0A5D8Z135_9GAMM|nr:hypothetical protein [Lysobacter lacus]TZF87783.1 hypothetical protein FW784_10690 [Lysobacter lacus]